MNYCFNFLVFHRVSKRQDTTSMDQQNEIYYSLISFIIELSVHTEHQKISTFRFATIVKVVGDPCQKITLLLLKSKSVRVIVPESCF